MTPMLATDLKRQAARAFGWSVVRSGVEQAFGLTVFLVLARLLSPEDFGLIALATAVIELLRLVSWVGLPEAVIRAPHPSDALMDTAFWTATGVSVVLAAAVVLAAGPLARLFDHPDLADILRVMAAIVVTSALGAIHTARLLRGFGHKALAIRAFAANLAGGAVGVAVAVSGGGVWALVAHRLVSEVVQTAAVWLGTRWVPRCRFVGRELADVAAFGAGMAVTTVCNNVNIRVQEGLTGLFLPVSAVGYLRIGNRMLDLAMQLAFLPAHYATLPSFARLQSQPEELRRAFLGAIRLAGMVAFPSFLGLAAIAPALVPAVLGTKWMPSVPVLQVLCVLVVPMTLDLFLGPVLVAVGWSRALAVFSVTKLVVGVVFTLVGLRWGIVGVGAALALRGWVTMPLAVLLLQRSCAIGGGAILRELWPSLAAAAAMAVATHVVTVELAARVHPGLAIPGAILFGLFAYGALMLTVARGFTVETLGSLTPVLPGRLREKLSQWCGNHPYSR